MEKENERQKGLISVIVPVYNASLWLGECMDSILQQTYRNLEIILVNDGSTDNSGAICDEYAARDRRVRVLHQVNRGVGEARNAGLDAAKGSYIGWVDADDVIEPEMFERLMAAGMDLSACAFRTFGSGSEVICNCGARGVYRHPHIMKVMAHIPVLWNKLSRRELWEGLRFPPCRVFDDETVSCSLLARAESLAVTEEAFYWYRIHPGSVSRSFSSEDSLPALEAACTRYLEMKELNPELSIYFLACVYEILRACKRSIGRYQTFSYLRNNIAPAAAFVAERQDELADCLGLGCLGRLEIKALVHGGYSACRFSRLCQSIYDFNNLRKQRGSLI